MPKKQTNEAPEIARGSDKDSVLTELAQLFSTFRKQLQTETPNPFDDPNAKTAVTTFNDIVAGLKFKFLPSALTIKGRPISLTEIELTWTDDTVNADGYKVKRSEGYDYQNFVEIRQLAPTARSFRDDKLLANTAYRYQLVSFNFRGEMPSNIVDVITTANPPHA